MSALCMVALMKNFSTLEGGVGVKVWFGVGEAGNVMAITPYSRGDDRVDNGSDVRGGLEVV